MEARLIFEKCVTVAECTHKLQALIETAPVVYGNINIGNNWNEQQHPTDNYRAKIMFIEKLPVKECEHEPDFYNIHGSEPKSFKCTKCGVELKAKWEVVK